MRALLLLLLVALALFLLRSFVPAPARAAGDAAEPASEAGVHFLPPPVPAAEPEITAPQADERKSAQEPAPRGEPARAVPAASVSSRSELEIAAVLVHGTPAEVQAAIAGLAPERALVIEAVAWAALGELQMARSLAARLEKGDVKGREKGLLEAAVTNQPLPDSGEGGTVLERAMEQALVARDGRERLAAKEYAAAARAFSHVLVSELAAPWEPDAKSLAEWTSGLDAAQREHRWNPRGQWPSVEFKVESGDSLITIRKRFLPEHPGGPMCAGLIERANRVRGFLQPGQSLRVPTDPVRLEVSLRARWALFFLGDEVAGSWPVGVGRPGEDTPPGEYVAIDKTENPAWMKVGQEPIPFGDPRNPLGTRWIGWGQSGRKTSYGLHGTTEPDSIGRAQSDGCVRFRNADIEEVFQILPEGAPIVVVG